MNLGPSYEVTSISFQQLVDLVQEDFLTYDRDWSRPGFRAVALHRVGRWRLGLPKLFRYALRIPYMFVYRWIRNHYGIELHATVRLGRRVTIANQGNVVIHVWSTIGDDCILRQNSTIGAGRGDRFDEAPVLGNGVELGCGAVVVGGVTIGDECRIGPNVVVFTNVPARSMLLPPAPRRVPLPGASQPRAEAFEQGEVLNA